MLESTFSETDDFFNNSNYAQLLLVVIMDAHTLPNPFIGFTNMWNVLIKSIECSCMKFVAAEFGKSHCNSVELSDDAPALEDDGTGRPDPQIDFEDHRRGEIPNRRSWGLRYLH